MMSETFAKLGTDNNYAPIPICSIGFNLEIKYEIERYIINDGATIIFWSDGTKTISKRHKEDKFDKEIGFLFAYFYKKWGDNKSAQKRVINSIDYKNIKTFLFEFYVKDSGKTTEQARKYLANLIVEK